MESANEVKVRCIDFEKGVDILEYDVRLPSTYSITVETTNPSITKVWTTLEFSLKPGSTLDELIKGIENRVYFSMDVKVTKVEKAIRPFTDLCPRCHELGKPKIVKKDTRDNRVRTGRYGEHSLPPKRPDEYWLTYVHAKSKKCRIRQFMNLPYPSYKENSIDISEHLFPCVIANLIDGSLQYLQKPC